MLTETLLSTIPLKFLNNYDEPLLLYNLKGNPNKKKG